MGAAIAAISPSPSLGFLGRITCSHSQSSSSACDPSDHLNTAAQCRAEHKRSPGYSLLSRSARSFSLEPSHPLPLLRHGLAYRQCQYISISFYRSWSLSDRVCASELTLLTRWSDGQLSFLVSSTVSCTSRHCKLDMTRRRWVGGKSPRTQCDPRLTIHDSSTALATTRKILHKLRVSCFTL